MIIEVAYATPDAQTLLQVEMPPRTTVADAVNCSGVLQRHPEIPWPDVAIGVFGSKVDADTRLQDGDRVEIYRPLRVDPKTRRRERAGG